MADKCISSTFSPNDVLIYTNTHNIFFCLHVNEKKNLLDKHCINSPLCWGVNLSHQVFKKGGCYEEKREGELFQRVDCSFGMKNKLKKNYKQKYLNSLS